MRVRLTVDERGLELDLEPRRTLADALRHEHGVVLGCADGTCDACAVSVDGEALRSCLVLAVQCDGARVRTTGGPDRP